MTQVDTYLLQQQNKGASIVILHETYYNAAIQEYIKNGFNEYENFDVLITNVLNSVPPKCIKIDNFNAMSIDSRRRNIIIYLSMFNFTFRDNDYRIYGSMIIQTYINENNKKLFDVKKEIDSLCNILRSSFNT